MTMPVFCDSDDTHTAASATSPMSNWNGGEARTVCGRCARQIEDDDNENAVCGSLPSLRPGWPSRGAPIFTTTESYTETTFVLGQVRLLAVLGSSSSTYHMIANHDLNPFSLGSAMGLSLPVLTSCSRDFSYSASTFVLNIAEPNGRGDPVAPRARKLPLPPPS
jgi:hypothetical protein